MTQIVYPHTTVQCQLCLCCFGDASSWFGLLHMHGTVSSCLAGPASCFPCRLQVTSHASIAQVTTSSITAHSLPYAHIYLINNIHIMLSPCSAALIMCTPVAAACCLPHGSHSVLLICESSAYSCLYVCFATSAPTSTHIHACYCTCRCILAQDNHACCSLLAACDCNAGCL